MGQKSVETLHGGNRSAITTIDLFNKVLFPPCFLLESEKMIRFAKWFLLLVCCLFATPAMAQQKRERICIDGVCYDVVNTATLATSTTAQVATDAAFIPVMRSDSAKFRKNLLEAARLARRSGDISIFQHLAIISASRNLKTLERLKGDVHELAIEDGMATIQAIDWDKLLAFIEKLLPIILKLIGGV